MHVSAATGVEAIREARARGLPVYGETLHQYLMYTQEDYKRPNGQIYHTYPSLKSEADQARSCGQAPWTARSTPWPPTKSAAPSTLKTHGKRIDDTTGGNVGVEPRVAIMYTEMVGRRGYSTREVRRPRLDQRREDHGALSAQRRDRRRAPMPTSRCSTRPGARRSRKEMLHEQDYSPWEGHEVHAWPSLTVTARQGGGGGRQVHGSAHGRPVPSSQDFRRDSQRSHVVIAAAARAQAFRATLVAGV